MFYLQVSWALLPTIFWESRVLKGLRAPGSES